MTTLEHKQRVLDHCAHLERVEEQQNAEREKMVRCLLECRAYFDDRADAEYGCGHAPVGNAEMRLLVMIDDVLEGL